MTSERTKARSLARRLRRLPPTILYTAPPLQVGIRCVRTATTATISNIERKSQSHNTATRAQVSKGVVHVMAALIFDLPCTRLCSLAPSAMRELRPRYFMRNQRISILSISLPSSFIFPKNPCTARHGAAQAQEMH